MIEVIPAIMPDSFTHLREEMSKVREYVPLVQIDVMDGVFVPPVTWPYHTPSDSDFEGVISGEEDMPFLNELEFEVDLMVAKQEQEAVRWIRAGAKRVIGHIEAIDDPAQFIRSVREATVPADSPLSVEVGLAIGVETPIEEIEGLADVDFVQCMGIARIGYQGESFDERVIPMIRALRSVFPERIISVDGGVSEETATRLVEAGAERLVSGSAIFEADNKEEVISHLRSLSHPNP